MLCTSLFHNDTLETVVIVILCTASAVPAEKVTLEGTAALAFMGGRLERRSAFEQVADWRLSSKGHRPFVLDSSGIQSRCSC